MTAARRPSVGLVPILLGGLVLLAVIGALVGALSRPPGIGQPSSSATSSPTVLVAGGSAWPADTVTASPTASPSPAPTASPTATPLAAPPSQVRGIAVRICRDVSRGRCVDELERVRGAFNVVVAFADSSRGDVLSIRLEGPSGTLRGPSLTLGGGRGSAWARFNGGLRAGRWLAIASVNGRDVGSAPFVAR